ncbi:MAG: hypothetical protein ABFQ62_04250 [Patescibacteria group bacterium]
MSADKKYKILYKKLQDLGLKDPEQIDDMIEKINSFANLIIDLYLEKKEA